MKPGHIRLLWVVYFLCLVPALVTLWHRTEFDRGFNSVALVADYVQLLELAQTENRPVDEVLAAVRDDAGVTRIALLEDTPQFLAQRGLCTIVEGVGWPGWKTPEEREEIERNRGREIEEAEPPSADWPLLMGLSHDKNHLIFDNPDVFRRIATAAQARYPGLVEVIERGNDGGIVSLAGEPKITLEWGLGFDPALVQHLKELGFTLYPRLRNYPEYTADVIDVVLAETAGLFPGGLLIFDGDMITGGSGLVRRTADAMRRLGLRAGWVEFAEQRGADVLADMLANSTARVHSIEDEEMEVITVDRAVARYLRSVRERAVRVVYLKPFLLAVDRADRIEKSVGMFGSVRSALESRGFAIGEPSIVAGPLSASFFARLASMVALAVGIALLLSTLNVRFHSAVFIIILVVVLAVCLLTGCMGQKVAVLGIALVSPTLAIAWLVRRYDGTWCDIRNVRITPFWPTISLWIGAMAITLTGGLLIAASLINQKTLLQIDAFSGVKLALYLPIVLAILIGVQIIIPEENRSFGSGVAWLLNVQLRIWHVLLALVGLIALFIMIDRSGNFPIISVADWENKVRGWLETMLYARPRTKEILVGHPALVLGLYLGLSSLSIRRPLMYAGIVAGSIALTSLTNTFCHIHTPLVLSLYRTGAGAVIGCIIGLILGVVIMSIVAHVGRRLAR